MPHFTTSDGLNLHYTDDGTGLPILCLAGLTRCGRDFDFVTPHLGGNRLIKLDYRGRGGSDWADDFTTYSIPREAQDVIELLDRLGLDKVAILGTSRGGLNAMFLAATAKHRIMGIAASSSPRPTKVWICAMIPNCVTRCWRGSNWVPQPKHGPCSRPAQAFPWR